MGRSTIESYLPNFTVNQAISGPAEKDIGL